MAIGKAEKDSAIVMISGNVQFAICNSVFGVHLILMVMELKAVRLAIAARWMCCLWKAIRCTTLLITVPIKEQL